LIIGNIATLGFARAEEPLAIIIGAEHTARVRRNLEAKGLSFAVISPLSLLDQKEDADLPDDAFARRSRGLSGDPPQALGAFLDGRRKPPPVVPQRVWFRSKIEAYLLTALIAGRPASDRLALSDDIYRELQATQYVTLVPSTLGLMGRDRVFELRAPVQDLKAPVDVWVRAAMVDANKAVTLEAALEDCLAGLADLRPKKGVPVHGAFPVLELASPDRPDDLFPCQPKLLLRRFVTKGRSFAPPLGIQVVHRSGWLQLALPHGGRGLPAIRLGYLGVGAALGNVRKAGEIDRVCLVVHVSLENVLVPVFPRWPVFHVVLVVVETRRGGERTPEVRQPIGEVRMDYDVWRREDDMFRAAGDWRWE
jgi:hypothetical protein